MHVCRYNSRFQVYSKSLCVKCISVDVKWPYMWSFQFLFHLTPITECTHCHECKHIKSEHTVIFHNWSLTLLWKMCIPFLALDTSSLWCLQSFSFYCSGYLIARDGHFWRRMLVRIQFLPVIVSYSDTYVLDHWWQELLEDLISKKCWNVYACFVFCKCACDIV